jgi:dihydropteroate synthase
VDLVLGGRRFKPTDRVVMAVVNRTPDSFYDRGAAYETAAAFDLVERHVAEGAAIIDVGGVKAGPGELVDEQEELRRTADFVAGVRARYPGVAISVDTWRAPVARVLLACGADLVNDTWAGHDPDLAVAAAEAGAGLVCAHTGGATPRTRPHRVAYDDVLADVIDTTTRLAETALGKGVRRDGVVIDPTHDFGKNTRHSLLLTRHLDRLVATGWPVLVALSRKDFIGETLDLPPAERLAGTLAATAISAWHGARIFRAHDTAATLQVLHTVSAIRGEREPLIGRRGLA